VTNAAMTMLAAEEFNPAILIIPVVIIFGIILVWLIFKFGMLWIQALTSNAHVGMFDLIGMWLRKVPPRIIVEARIMCVQANKEISPDFFNSHYLASASKPGSDPGQNVRTLASALVMMNQAGLSLSPPEMASHVLAGGNIQAVVRALISAERAKITMDFRTACAIDLAGRDVEDAIHTSVNPRVIDCPAHTGEKKTIDAVAKDGIQLMAKARVTVRTNLSQLIGGATEETVIARVGEGIVSAIGSSKDYKAVLENPEVISKAVLAKSLDAGTAFSILSIDIADVDVGMNVGAALQAKQAEADLQVARAKAEERRAAAAAREQEMKALVVENRAKVVLAEAEIPLAMAEAFRKGNMGIMDYYNLRNIQADTSMRSTLGGAQPEGQA
jgi:uncharacterized protein YqfA (UPF0365 family)